jgi:regulation of enolase protein 1 (concanavalin A-like superfamily)
VYFGIDAGAVQNATPAEPLNVYRGRQAETTFTPKEPLQWGQTYYWRVDEVKDGHPKSPWKGMVWSFTVATYLIVDDFESYANESPTRLFQTWIDGFGFSADAFFTMDNPGNGTGSGVGHDIWSTDSPQYGKTIAETTIVNGGRQSMPLYYNNKTVATSEALRTWTSAQDWTVQGSDTLTLAFRGTPVGFLEKAPGQILMNGVGTDIYGTTDQGRFVYKQLTGDGSIIARVDRLDNTNAWAKGGVMIRGNLDPTGSWAYIMWAGDNGVRFQARTSLGASATSDTELGPPADQVALRAPVWVKLERVGNDFKGYYSTDGTAWTALAWNPRTISMNSSVYIGLAVTSHTASAITQAEFSGVTTTGNVTGQWESVSLGVEQPAGNLPDTLYLTIEDSSGHKATVTHSDPFAVNLGLWTPWSIPLSTFSSAGVAIDSVKKMTVGIGDKTKPASGATGLLYIDDIRVVKPTAEQ